jgi:hypothetical protein
MGQLGPQIALTGPSVGSAAKQQHAENAEERAVEVRNYYSMTTKCLRNECQITASGLPNDGELPPQCPLPRGAESPQRGALRGAASPAQRPPERAEAVLEDARNGAFWSQPAGDDGRLQKQAAEIEAKIEMQSHPGGRLQYDVYEIVKRTSPGLFALATLDHEAPSPPGPPITLALGHEALSPPGEKGVDVGGMLAEDAPHAGLEHAEHDGAGGGPAAGRTS